MSRPQSRGETYADFVRDQNIYTARVLLREAMARRGSPDFHATLLEWAGNARRRAQAAKPEAVQADLFDRGKV